MNDDAVNAVREALQEPNPVPVLAWELEHLWGDLDTARQHALNGRWSIGCDHMILRITILTRALGRAVDWGNVPYRLLLDGTYTRVHEAMGIEPQPFDVEEVRQAWENYLGRNLA